MAHAIEPETSSWTVADLAERFGPMPIWRIRLVPAPGTAREEDVVEINDHEDRLCELVDGVLVEKTVGAYESYLAALMGTLLRNYIAEHRLGIVLGADGMMLLAPGLVRIPDVSFISFERLPQGKVPRTAFFELAPDLAVEIISRSNTPKEMRRKLADYFTAGVRLVWYVYAAKRTVAVYTAADRHVIVREQETLTGGDVLPGFLLSLREYFAEPGAGATKAV